MKRSVRLDYVREQERRVAHQDMELGHLKMQVDLLEKRLTATREELMQVKQARDNWKREYCNAVAQLLDARKKLNAITPDAKLDQLLELLDDISKDTRTDTFTLAELTDLVEQLKEDE